MAAKKSPRNPTYVSWRMMLVRCRNENFHNFHRYGGRGIEVCARWNSFENFLADMGERPAGHSIDRWPDNDGNYEPSNCRWATRSEQNRNRAGNRIVEIDGRSMCVTEASELFGVNACTAVSRMDKGMPAELAFKLPPLPNCQRTTSR